jgi:CheY-like chemotaxis protein
MPMNDEYKILHLEDELADAELIERELRKSNIRFELLLVDTEDDFIRALDEFFPDIILCDHTLPSFNSLEAFKIVKDKKLAIPFILISATMTEDLAMNVVSEGADDFIFKDRLKRLPAAVTGAIQKFRLIVANKELISQNREKEQRATELVVANKRLLVQYEDNEKRSAQLLEANNKDLDGYSYSNIQILLVEDNKSDAMLTIRALKKHSLANNLLHLGDGAEALDFIFGKGAYSQRNIENTPKVIFLDLKMPKVSGLEVLRIIKSDERTKFIPIVIMTSSVEDEDLIESNKLGVTSYVVKPVGFENFSKTITDLGFYWLVVNNTLQ